MELASLIGKKHVVLTSRCNTAIYASLLIAKHLKYKKVLVVDQSGWSTHRTYPKELTFEVVELKTNDGLITKESLEEHKDCVLLYQTVAGYFAEQDLEMIYSVAKKNKIFLIEDICPSVGLLKSKADIAVCSFGRWKPLNLGTGGCIAFDENYEEIIPDYIKKNTFDGNLDKLDEKINQLPERYDLFFKTVKKVKRDLSNFEVVHQYKRGINVVVAFKNEEEKKKITTYCEKHNLEFTECPKYIRLQRNAISIEIKRL